MRKSWSYFRFWLMERASSSSGLRFFIATERPQSKSSIKLSSPGLSTRRKMIFFRFELIVDVTGEVTCHLSNFRPKFFNSLLSCSVKSREAPLFCRKTITFLLLRFVFSPSCWLSTLPSDWVPTPILRALDYKSVHLIWRIFLIVVFFYYSTSWEI